MKSRFLKVVLCFILFFSLLGMSYLLLRPFYDKIGSEAEGALSSFSENLKEKTGLSFTYDSLSPGIIGGIRVYNISVIDAETRIPFCRIDSLFINYSFRELLQGDIMQALKTVTLQDVNVEITRNLNDSWIKKLAGGKKASEEVKVQSEDQDDGSSLNLDDIHLELPFAVNIYHLRFLYRDVNDTAEFYIWTATLQDSENGAIDAKLYADFTMDIQSEHLVGEMDFNSSIVKTLDNSSAVINISNLTDGNFTVRNIGFLSEYAHHELAFKMLPSVQNIYGEITADLDSRTVKARVETGDFTLSKLVTMRKKSSAIEKFYAMNFSVSGRADWNWETGQKHYESNGDVFVPASVFPEREYSDNLVVSYSVTGDDRFVQLPYFSVGGEKYNASFSGSYDIRTMQPSGNLSLESIMLPNGGIISSEIYIDPLTEGFMCFSPEVAFGEKSFTAAQLTVVPDGDSVDFNFEISDYSHPDSEKPGVLTIFGSYLRSSNSTQASISFDTVYIDSMIELAAFFADANMAPLVRSPAPMFKTTVFSCDFYASMVGRAYSYSVPYAIVANTVQDDQMLIVALDGNEDAFQVSRFELAYGGQSVSLTGESEKLPGNDARSLSGHMNINEFPYEFTGFMNDNVITVNGDYGLTYSMLTDYQNAVITGAVSMTDLPLNIASTLISCTCDTGFEFSASGGTEIHFRQMEFASLDDDNRLKPRLAFSGNVGESGIHFDTLSYSDIVSSLDGNGNINWSLSDNIFNDALISFSLSDGAGMEDVSFEGVITNPESKSLSLENVMNDFLFDINFNVQSLRSQRFVYDSRPDDTLTAQISLTGNLSNPYALISVPRAGFTMGDKPFVLTGNILLDDLILTLQDAKVDFGDTYVKDLTAHFNFADWKGNLGFGLDTTVMGSTVSANVRLTCDAVSEVQPMKLPEILNFRLDVDKPSGTFIRNPQPLWLSVMKINDELMLSSSANLGISGMVTKRDVDIKIDNKLPFRMNISGFHNDTDLNIAVSDVEFDLAKTLKLINFNMVKVYKGMVTGGFTVTGTYNNPEFYGALDIIPAEFNLPSFFHAHAETKKIALIMEKSSFYTEPTRCSMRHVPLDVTLLIRMRKFAFDSFEIITQTAGEAYAPLNFNLNQIHVKGDFRTDLDILYDNTNTLSVSGSLVGKDANAEFGASRVSEMIQGLSRSDDADESNDDEMAVDVDLNIVATTRVQISYGTFLRAVVVPGAEIDVTYSSETENLSLDGTVPIRSGEIIYLNNSFYIKEGEIQFNSSEGGLSPIVTLRAETKTRDSRNELVTLSFAVDHQRLDENLSPQISASPARSEKEIMEILGTIVSGNSDSATSFMLATGDYALQMMITRRLENALRDFFNFDIFSVRTMVVQNAVRQSMAKKTDNSEYGIGNYFDNTTVYIGKYVGDAIFADAMLRLDYDKNRINDRSTIQGLVFHPEIGFELDSPFARIRWSLSPDLDDIMNLNLVQNAAVTFSWKFEF